MSKTRATLIGFTAVLMWSLLALLTAASGRVPPFQLAAMSFAIAAAAGFLSRLFRAGARGRPRPPAGAWLLGVAGLFGYHFFYFTALKSAPPVEAGLINYLWPLLIVLMAASLPGERLGWHHVAGALLGLFGTVLIVTGGEGLGIKADYAPGYAAALVAAVIWSVYSVMSRRFAGVPSDAVAGFCLLTALLSAASHLMVEETIWPARPTEWLAVAGLGLGPVGIAFYVWDYGVKHGDIAVLGASAYMAPLLSTGILILAGFGVASWTVAIACLAITGGAALAAKDLLAARARSPAAD
ncbi:MAG: EamA family transporter [Hyphomicrobiales bacterium]|nr:EamA family transporter [Hyphomicrobiales bacterium]